MSHDGTAGRQHDRARENALQRARHHQLKRDEVARDRREQAVLDLPGKSELPPWEASRIARAVRTEEAEELTFLHLQIGRIERDRAGQ